MDSWSEHIADRQWPQSDCIFEEYKLALLFWASVNMDCKWNSAVNLIQDIREMVIVFLHYNQDSQSDPI
jgi:hypothetical protein